MNLQEQIAAFAAEAATRTGRSKLEPYEGLIRTLRQKRWTYAEISTALRDRFQLSVAPGTVHSLMQVRARSKPSTPPALFPPVPQQSEPPGGSAPRKRFRLDF
jgi:hypothetical protein